MLLIDPDQDSINIEKYALMKSLIFSFSVN